MKEKTFEELIEESEAEIFLHGYKYYSVHEVNKLLQQVREATIAECRDIASEFSLSDTLKHIDNLPPNSIKTDL